MSNFQIDNDELVFSNYEFPPAPVYPTGRLARHQVSEIVILTGQARVRCEPFQLLRIPFLDREQVFEWAHRTNIPCNEWIDVWGNLLEPFLDTEYTNERAAKIESELSSVGMDATTVKALRSEVSSMMKAYNFDSMLWDWTYLDIFDLLSAARGTLSGPQYAMEENQFFHFYFRVINIALQGQKPSAQRTSHNTV